LPLFIEHEIDYQTFLSLEDADLKELGIKALGSRKKILSVINECKESKAKPWEKF
jgi:CRISPR/Cas system-associated protein Cas5 (RAMP superfamily)